MEFPAVETTDRRRDRDRGRGEGALGCVYLQFWWGVKVVEDLVTSGDVLVWFW